MIDPLLTGVDAMEVCSLPAMGGKCVLDRLQRPPFGQFRGSRAFGQFYVSRAFGRAVIGPCSQPLALLDRRFCNVSFRLRFRLLRFRSATARDIFPAVDRRFVRRISIEIGTSYSNLLGALVDPCPAYLVGVP